jgi:RNA polymerase sigma-70 factor (ECF subfamily)
MADERVKSEIERLAAEHHQVVYRYAYRLSGSAADAEDLTQQVFLVALERLDQLRRPESARSWLFAILRNCFLKTWQRREAVSAAALGLNLDGLPAAANDGAAVDAARLHEALGELPPDYRAVLVMFYFDDCSYREIAEELQVPMGTVMSRLARAKRHLRARLFEAEAPAEAAAKKG